MELAPFLQDGSGQLARRSVRATIATTVAAGLDFAVRLGSVAILARLVSPADFGVVMVAGAAVAIAEQFRDLGLSTATLQRPDLSAAEVTNLFWINAAAGLLLALALCALSPALAWLLGDPRLIPVTCGLALTLPAGGLAVQHQALLGRNLRAGPWPRCGSGPGWSPLRWRSGWRHAGPAAGPCFGARSPRRAPDGRHVVPFAVAAGTAAQSRQHPPASSLRGGRARLQPARRAGGRQ